MADVRWWLPALLFGGDFIDPNGSTNAATVTMAGVDSFIVWFFVGSNSATFLIDGAAPASVSTVAVPNGHSYALVKAAGVGTHTLSVTSPSDHIRGVDGYNSTMHGVRVVNSAAGGASSSQQLSTTSSYFNFPYFASDGYDLAIINLGLNDINGGNSVSSTDYGNNLQAAITALTPNTDVLLVFPHPAGNNGSTYRNFQLNVGTYRDTAANVASTNNVAFLSLFDYFGGVFTPALQARMADGLVHGNAAFYAEVGDVYRQCVLAMAA